MHARERPGYGRGEVTLSTEELRDAVQADPVEQLRAIFASESYRPPVLPAVALEVHALTQRPDVSLGDLVGLLERDPMLAADVLRIAQSPAFATRVPPRSLSDAVMRLGVRQVRDVVWTVALNGRVFRAPGYDAILESLQRHSTVTARIATLVAQRTSISSEYAYLCGLLHDIGMVASLIALAERDRSKRAAPSAASPNLGQELEAVHEEAGETVARLWSLPMDVTLVIGHHHDPRIQGFCHPLAAVVCVAQTIATELGAGAALGEGVDTSEAHVVTYALSQLGMDPRAVVQIAQEARNRALS